MNWRRSGRLPAALWFDGDAAGAFSMSDTVGNTADDRAAFREAMRELGVTPRRAAGRQPSPPGPTVHEPRARRPEFVGVDAPVKSRARRPRADRGVLLDTTDGGDGEAVAFARGGVQKAVMRKLKRGDIRPSARLDLHQHTAAEAEAAIDRFLTRAAGRGASSALIVHGKGLRSGARGGVLKGVTCACLKRHPAMLAFCSAQPRDGGSGAMYVLLQAPRGRRK